MFNYLLPILLALGSWWLCTGIILFLNQLPTRTYRISLTVATALCLGCIASLVPVAESTTEFAATAGFAQGLAIWAWLEMTYLMGALTGSSKSPCPPGCTGWARFAAALRTSIYHEIAVIAAGILIISVTWNQPNEFAALTFLTLWLMRWSAKLNLFLGVANINDEWFPEHMRYLASYIPRRPMNPLFPVSVLVASVFAFYGAILAASAETAHSLFGYTLVTTLLCLGILEHGFMVLRVHESALWNWALKAATRCSAVGGK